MSEAEVGAGRIGVLSSIDVGMVSLGALTGSFLTVEAEFDLNLYPSFVSTDLVQRLGLAAHLHALSDDEASPVVINGQSYEVLGTISITVEAFTRETPAFEDMFYVFGSNNSSGEVDAPELVFEIDHVRRGGGLALKQDSFA